MSLFSLDWFWYRAMDLNERTRSGSRRPCGPGDVKPTPIRKEGEMVVLINPFLFCLWVWNWGCIRQTSWSDFDGVLGQEKRSYPSPDWIKNIPRLMLGVMALGLYPYPTQITLTHFTGCNHSNKHFNLKVNCIRSLHALTNNNNLESDNCFMFCTCRFITVQSKTSVYTYTFNLPVQLRPKFPKLDSVFLYIWGKLTAVIFKHGAFNVYQERNTSAKPIWNIKISKQTDNYLYPCSFLYKVNFIYIEEVH